MADSKILLIFGSVGLAREVEYSADNRLIQEKIGLNTAGT